MNQKLAYTVGEPAGIGPDLILMCSDKMCLKDVVLVGDKECLRARADKLGIDFPKDINIEHVPVARQCVLGEPVKENVSGVLAMLDTAIQGCMDGSFDAMVTGPVHKGIINNAGEAFSGHTEYIADKTGGAVPVMLLGTEHLKVGLVTTHLPLRLVADAITAKKIERVCQIIHDDFQSKFGIDRPLIRVCGLNPHAGEDGVLGMEEIEIIEPTLAKLRQMGMNVHGPYPADTVFTPKYTNDADVILAMYHDQGLPVLKAQGFGQAANITLGLPIIRTSVDHGTAFDLAGTGEVDVGSLLTAFKVARQMISRNRNG